MKLKNWFKRPEAAIQKSEAIENIKVNLHIDGNSEYSDILKGMNQMCHQKIKAKDKWGAIPMNTDTIGQLYNAINESKFKHRDELLSYVEEWKKGNFEYFSGTHDYVLMLQGGNKGWSTGNASPEEEDQFILENFGSKLDE